MSNFKLGRVAGIDLYLHWTFPVLILIWAVQGYEAGGTMSAVFNTAIGLAVFGCVLLHEFGHALTARRYGIETWGITLSPIGGLAHLESVPREPHKEFWITIAGPLVNVAIAGLLYGLTTLVDPSTLTSRTSLIAYAFATQLMWINIWLALFNMLPAFPMDGGRILRATLAIWMQYGDATRIAVRVGQVVAVGIAVASVMGYLSMMGLLIAYFVFVSGNQELERVY